MKLSNKQFDVLKYIARFLLPATGTLYFALAGIWNFPYGEQVVGTITALVTFMNVALGISSNAYDKENVSGTLVTTKEADDARTVQVIFDVETPEELDQLMDQREITLEVNANDKSQV